MVAAAVAATTFLALPYATLAALDGARGWYDLPIAADLVALAAVAVRLWAPLTVLAAAVLSLACAVLFFFAVAASDTCGHSTAASAVEWTGAIAIAIPIATWAVLGGVRFVWRFPLAWLAAALWTIAWAHVIPHAAGGCFE